MQRHPVLLQERCFLKYDVAGLHYGRPTLSTLRVGDTGTVSVTVDGYTASMIPYFRVPILFPLLVCAGIVAGMYVTRIRAAQLGLSNSIESLMKWAVGVGLPASHFIDVLVYRFPEFVSQPLIILDQRRGWSLSSYGGFFSGISVVFLWCRAKRTLLLPYLDSLAVGIVTGFVFGRLGCFFVHDHIGSRTNFPLSVMFIDGKRHDLGLDEFIVCLLLAGLCLLLMRKMRPVGTYIALVCVIYGPVRFILDFLRAADIPGSDIRWFGLTPAQYCSIPVALYGTWLTFRLFRRKPTPTAKNDFSSNSAHEWIRKLLTNI